MNWQQLREGLAPAGHPAISATLATAVSVGGAFALEHTDGAGRWVAAAGVAVTCALLYLACSTRPRNSRPSFEHLLLSAVSLVAGAWVLRSTGASVEGWRLTAAALAVTAPNWYLTAANLSRPLRVGVGR